MEEVAELSVKITPDDQATEPIARNFDRAARNVEARGNRMSRTLTAGFTALGTAIGGGLISRAFSRDAAEVESRAERMSESTSRSFAKIGVSLVGAFAVETALDNIDNLEQKVSEVLTLLDDQTPEAFNALADDVLNFQEQLGIATDETVPALYQAISAGQGDDPFGFLEVAREASVGGLTSLETAVASLSGTLNAYGDESVTATRVSDSLFTAVRLGVTTFGELATALPNVTATAAATGIEIEEVNAALAALTLNGIDTRRASTFLNGALVELSRSGTKASTAFEELTEGLTFQEFIDEGNTFIDAVKLIGEGTEAAGTSILDIFGSVEAGRAVLALTRNDGQAVTDVYNEMGASFGATARAADTMGRTAQSIQGRIKALLEVASTRFGEQASPFITEFLLVVEEALPAVIDLASALGGTFSLALQAALPLVQGAGEALEFVANVLTALPTEVLGAAGAFLTLNSTLSSGRALLAFATNSRAGVAAVNGLSSAATAASGILPGFAGQISKVSGSLGPLARTLTTTAAALPALGAALAVGIGLWRRYQAAQEAARERARAWADAADAAIPPSERLDARIKALADQFDALAAAAGDSTDVVPEVVGEYEALLDLIDGLDDSSRRAFDSFVEIGGDLADVAQAAGDAADPFERLRDSLDVGRADALTSFREEAQQLSPVAQQVAADIEELAFQQALATEAGQNFQGIPRSELEQDRAFLNLLGLQLVQITNEFQVLGDTAQDALQVRESGLRDEVDAAARAGDEWAISVRNQAQALDAAGGTLSPYIDALGAVEEQTLQAAIDAGALDTAVRGVAGAVEVAQDATALDIWESFGGTLEDLGEQFSDLIADLTDFDAVLDDVNSSLRNAFDIGNAQRRVVQDLDAAYEDLTDELGEVFSVQGDGADRIEELTEKYKEEIKTGIGPKAKALDAEIKALKKADAQRRQSARILDDETDAGREAFNVLTEYGEQVLDTAETQLQLGASLGEVEQFLREQEELLFNQAVAAGVSESAMIDYVNQLDLTPDSINTLIELVGPDAAIQDIIDVVSSLEDVPAEVQAEVALLGADATITDILGVLSQLEDFAELREVEAEVSVIGADDAVTQLRDVSDAFLEVNGYPPEIPFDVTVTGAEDAAADTRAVVDTFIDLTGYPPEFPFEVKVEADEALLTLAEVTQYLLDLQGYPPEIPFDIPVTGGDSLGDVTAQINDLDEEVITEVTVEGIDEALFDLQEVELAAQTVEDSDPEVLVTALTEDASSELDDIAEQLAALDGMTVTVDVITNLSGGGLPGAEAGGVFDVPGTGVPVRIGEAGREYAIPVANPRYRDRAIQMVNAAARDLGMTAPASAPAQAVAAPSPTVSIEAAPFELPAQEIVVRFEETERLSRVGQRFARSMEELFSI